MKKSRINHMAGVNFLNVHKTMQHETNAQTMRTCVWLACNQTFLCIEL